MQIHEANGIVEGSTAAVPGRATILVIDDREENRMVIRYLFDEADIRVLEAAEGTRALELAASEAPDCILLDLSMPGLSGFEVLERLQEDPRTREIPVIILTATDESLETMERTLGRGAVDYITKPISPGRVAVRVRAAIERRRLQKELDQLRASFTSMLVHDLRAPLTVVKAYVELFQASSDALSDKHQRYLRAMAESCQRMIRLIGDILDVSKLEAGRLALDRRPLDVVRLIGDIADRVGPVAQHRSITLAVDHSADPLPLVWGDALRLEQVLMNLLDNALKFTAEGGEVRIVITDLRDAIEVAVVDTGPGIAPEEMPFLFEKFSQTTSGKSHGHGTGLGLVICRHLIEAHGGRIWAESEPGQGSRFIFRLPWSSAGPAHE
jgi:signal transduction histidine kinase